MAQGTLSRFGLNKDDGKHGQDSVWNHPLHTGTVVPDLQLERVAGGRWHRGCFIGNKGGQQGRHDENVDCQVIQGEMGRNWMMTSLWVDW